MSLWYDESFCLRCVQLMDEGARHHAAALSVWQLYCGTCTVRFVVEAAAYGCR